MENNREKRKFEVLEEGLVKTISPEEKKERRELDEQLKSIGVEEGVDAPLLTVPGVDDVTLKGVVNLANMLPRNKENPYKIDTTGMVNKNSGGKRRRTRRRSKKSKKRKTKRRRYRK